MTTNNASSSSSSSTAPTVAGRTNYRQWDKVASDLEKSAQLEEEKEKENSNKTLGLDGKYARSESEAKEREKLKLAQETKKQLEKYLRRERNVIQTFRGLLGGNDDDTDSDEHHHRVVRLTREHVDAGKRVVTVCDTAGHHASRKDTIILTQDLSHLESKMAAGNNNHTKKSYEEDAENDVVEPSANAAPPRSAFGLIKVFLSNLQNCTVVVRCKVISGSLELSRCSNVNLRIEKEATIATLQADLSQDIAIEFVDAPSGKNTTNHLLGQQPHNHYWGEDSNDRIFHAGVSNMNVKLIRDGFVETQTTTDYVKDGAVAVGNATPEEFQFVTSVLNGDFTTEKVVRHGSSTGKNVRPMTERELEEEKEKREQAVDMALDKVIQFQEKNPKEVTMEPVIETVSDDEEDVEGEVFTSMSKAEIDTIVADCETNKSRGNEAFAAGEYAQAILLYSLALDKASELPDKDGGATKSLFPRHIVLSNRSASFLKLGEHEKALEDAKSAHELDPTYVKAIFRHGLALHAMGRYEEAIPVLAEAQKIEPKNKQIKQALQFAEVRMTQEMRKRMSQG